MKGKALKYLAEDRFWGGVVAANSSYSLSKLNHVSFYDKN